MTQASHQPYLGTWMSQMPTVTMLQAEHSIVRWPHGPRVERLTAQEVRILEMVCDGDSNKAIADKLNVTVHTIKYHLKNIFGKLNVTCRIRAVATAIHLRIVTPEWVKSHDAEGYR